MKNIFSGLTFFILSLFIPFQFAKADVLLSAVSLGIYPVAVIKAGDELLITTCLHEAFNGSAAIGGLCPFAFILDEGGTTSLSSDSIKNLREQGFSEAEIGQIQAQGARVVSESRQDNGLGIQ